MTKIIIARASPLPLRGRVAGEAGRMKGVERGGTASLGKVAKPSRLARPSLVRQAPHDVFPHTGGRRRHSRAIVRAKCNSSAGNFDAMGGMGGRRFACKRLDTSGREADSLRHNNSYAVADCDHNVAVSTPRHNPRTDWRWGHRERPFFHRRVAGVLEGSGCSDYGLAHDSGVDRRMDCVEKKGPTQGARPSQRPHPFHQLANLFLGCDEHHGAAVRSIFTAVAVRLEEAK
jgi:hypothetical protein